MIVDAMLNDTQHHWRFGRDCLGVARIRGSGGGGGAEVVAVGAQAASFSIHLRVFDAPASQLEKDAETYNERYEDQNQLRVPLCHGLFPTATTG